MAEAPQTLGRYRLQRKIGAGAMGLVYEALDPKLNRPVAIKTILKSHLDEEVSREYSVRFREEAQAVARLNHPNIVQVYDFGEEGDIAFIVMEFIRGRDLKHCFDNNQRFEAKEFVRLMCELLSALDYAHEAGIVHRDIKPANIMLDGQNRAKLMDFGVARITDTERTHRTQVGTMVGTPSYMSPEQVQGLWVDHRSDLFSSGIVLYQFLTGKRPFTGGDWTLRKAIVNDEPVRPSQINAALSPEFDRVVSRALAKAPEARYQSAGDFSAALQRVLEGKPAEDDGDQTVMRPAASAAPAVPGAPPAASPAEPSAPASGSPEVEVEFWRSIKDSEDPEDYELYLQQFPRGAYVRLAQRKMAKLRPGGQGTSTGTGSQNLGDSKLEVDTRVREAEARAKREAAEKLKRQAEDKARLEVERVRRESEERPRREADETAARRLAEEKSRREAAEEKARREAAEEMARREAAEEMARREAESRASPVAPSPVAPAPVAPAPVAPAPAARAPVEPVRREPDERARLEAEIRAKREAEEKAWREGQERARRAAEERAKRQAEAKAQPASADAPEEKRVEAPEDLTVAVAAAVAKVAPKRGAPVVPLALAGGALLVVAAGAYFALRSPEEPVSSAQPPPQLVKVDPAPAPAAAPPAPAAQPAPQLIPPAVQPAPPPPEPAPAEPAPAATQPSPAKPPSVQEKAKRDAEEKAAREAEEHARRQRAEQEQREKAKLAAEEKKRQTAARLAEEEKKRAEAARLAAEEDRKRQAARQAAEEEKKRAEAARLAEEQKKRAEAARLAAEEEKKRAEAARLAAAEEEKKRAAAKAAEEQKRAKAPELFARAAELEGQGKVAEAVKLYTAAANANHGPSAKKLGDIYSGGKGDVAQDYTASLRWHAKARQLGETVQRGGTR